ncbi:MAG: helix-turn-helix domain-containing protein [Nanoarchaeota archaeon]
MWQLKIRAREKWNIYNSRAVKFGVSIYLYSQNYYEEKGRIFFVASGIVDGDEKSRNRFLKDLRKEAKVEHLEWKEAFFSCIYSEPKTAQRVVALKFVYNPRLIHLKPVIFDSEGWEEWEVASIRKEDLNGIIDWAGRLNNVESKVLYLKESKINDVMIYSLLPSLTEKQKNVLLLAVKEGYYGYPRKITLEKLAKISDLSVSTYQFHLAKAEAKLLPFVAKRI